ncbi:MAG TPA: hypothetical protein VFP98_11060 [Candidatus Polarisedimenticolia bacterium]|nr:hypothetical protein [Candidatus Polarisedimenticolia bacterium]
MFNEGRLAGITVSQSEDESRAIPVEILRAFLERDPAAGGAAGFPTLGVNWQINRDAAVSEFLGQEGSPQGILVRQVPWGTTGCGSLKPRDILLELGGEPIDSDGYYLHARLGRLGFNHILAERFRPGDSVAARVLRDGREHRLTLTARAHPAALDFIPFHQHTAPPYIIVGGLIIRELDVPYLRTWGKDWTKDAPDSLLSLYYYGTGGQTPERRRTVLITSVLPSAYNAGYHDLRDVVIERINGRLIGKIEDVTDALGDARDGYHVIDLSPEAPQGQIVLDAASCDAATGEIIKAYGIPYSSRPREEPLPEGGEECTGAY